MTCQKTSRMQGRNKGAQEERRPMPPSLITILH